MVFGPELLHEIFVKHLSSHSHSVNKRNDEALECDDYHREQDIGEEFRVIIWHERSRRGTCLRRSNCHCIVSTVHIYFLKIIDKIQNNLLTLIKYNISAIIKN
jgi:hypothetical protein